MAKYTKILGAKVLTCSLCENCDIDKVKSPCATCPDNRNYQSHFKPHKVYKSILDSGAISVKEVKK